jgi:hypothetical protein
MMPVIDTSRLRRRPPWDDRERATLVALLRERPCPVTWQGSPLRSSKRVVRDRCGMLAMSSRYSRPRLLLRLLRWRDSRQALRTLLVQVGPHAAAAALMDEFPWADVLPESRIEPTGTALILADGSPGLSQSVSLT